MQYIITSRTVEIVHALNRFNIFKHVGVCTFLPDRGAQLVISTALRRATYRRTFSAMALDSRDKGSNP